MTRPLEPYTRYTTSLVSDDPQRAKAQLNGNTATNRVPVTLRIPTRDLAAVRQIAAAHDSTTSRTLAALVRDGLRSRNQSDQAAR